MWPSRESVERIVQREGSIAVAIDRDKSSTLALKWSIEHCIPRGGKVKLVHVIQRPISQAPLEEDLFEEGQLRQQHHQQQQNRSSQLFLSLRCLCMRRNIRSEVFLLEELNVAKALIEFISKNNIGTMVLGASSKKTITRLFKEEIPTNVVRWAPDSCNVLVVSKGKLSAARSATRPLPLACPLPSARFEALSSETGNDETVSVMSVSKEESSYEEMSTLESDVGASSGRLSTDSSFLSFYENLRARTGHEKPPQRQHSRNESQFLGMHLQTPHETFSASDSIGSSMSLENMEDVEEEMRRLKMELKCTMDMYHAACKEALAAKQKAEELQTWKNRLEKRLREAFVAEETALLVVKQERSKCRVAIERAEAAEKMAIAEAKRRMEVEKDAGGKAEEKKKLVDTWEDSDVALKYKSLLHILVVLFLFQCYIYTFR